MRIALLAAGPQDDKPGQDDIDEWVDKLKDTGTPDNISDDARNGFDVLVDALEEVDVDDLDKTSDVEDIVQNEDDRKDAEKFFQYWLEECVPGGADLPTELPSGLPTELPTELPSGLPSELPSGFPTDIPTDPEELESHLSEMASAYPTQ